MANQMRVTRVRLNEQVAALFREEILSGKLKPGDRMVQSEWADHLGISRMPVRDAFLQLQSEGILTASQNGVAHVASLSEADIRDAYEICAFAVSISAARAATRMGRSARDELERVHATYVEAVASDNRDELFAANERFHRILNVESRSPRLIAMLRMLSAGLPHVGTREIGDWRRRSVVSHEQILQALRDDKPELVGELMRAHVLEAADVVTQYLRDQGFWGTADAASESAS